MRRRNGNYSIGNKKFKPTELHGQRFYDLFDKAFNLQPKGEPNKSPSNLVQEKPSDSTSQSAINKADEVCPIECKRTAGIFLASHASAPFLNDPLPHPRCALAYSLWDDVESDSDIDGKDNIHAWQPKMGSSPIHPLSAGRISRVSDLFQWEQHQTYKMPLMSGLLRIPADSNEEPASDLLPVQPSYLQTFG